MKTSQVVLSKSDSPFLFRSIIPKDLVEYFNGRTRFHISLKNVTNKETKFVSVFLKSLVKNLYNEIRMGKNLSLEDVKVYWFSVNWNFPCFELVLKDNPNRRRECVRTERVIRLKKK